jgi:hypothetical protein
MSARASRPRPRLARAWFAAALLPCLCAPQARAAPETYGDWSLVSDGDVRVAQTSNELVAVGISCQVSAQSCFAYVAPRLSSCNEGQATALLLSSPAGSAGAMAMCRRVRGQLVGVLEDAQIVRLMTEGDDGFRLVIPMSNGSFQISSFSSRGAASALRAAIDAQAALPSPSRPKPRAEPAPEPEPDPLIRACGGTRCRDGGWT